MYIATANRACSLIYSYIKKHTLQDGVWLLPVNVCPVVPLTFYSANIQFKFVDINPKSLCINEDDCINLVKNAPQGYCGIIFVRTYGYVYDTTTFFSNIHDISPNIHIIDDRCLCLPEIEPQSFGSDMIVYSTGHCKQIDLGIGGFALYEQNETYEIDNYLYYDGTDEEKLYKEAYNNNHNLKAIPYGWLKLDSYTDAHTYWEEIKGKIDNRNTQRESINNIYRNRLPIEIQMEEHFQQWRFNIRVPNALKNKILQALFNNDLFASNHYHSANRLFDQRSFENSDELYKSVINLFNDNHYTPEMATRTTDVINKILRTNDNTYSFQ